MQSIPTKNHQRQQKLTLSFAFIKISSFRAELILVPDSLSGLTSALQNHHEELKDVIGRRDKTD